MPPSISPIRPLVEICLESVQDVQIAAAAGADRLELCSALALGGLTPSMGAIAAVRAVTSLPIMVMIRPRPGGFVYAAEEWAVMQRDIDFAIEAGADGIVFGMLTADGQIDMPRSTQIVRRIEAAPRRLQIVFHRAFDFTADPLTALDRLIDLGVHRVLTSGQKPTALEGALLIRTLVERSAGRIEILPAAGIRPENVARLIAQTGCVQVHASLRQPIADPVLDLSRSISLAHSSAFADHASLTATSRNDVEALIARLNDAPIAQ